MKINRLTLLTATSLLPVALHAQGNGSKTAAPTLCLVRGEPIADAAKAPAKYEIGGKTYYVCCTGCKAKVDKATDAEKAKLAKITDLRTEKVVLESRLKAVDSELKNLTGEKKDSKPAATTLAPKVAGPNDTVYCVVTDEEIGTPDKAVGTVVYNNKTYYLCCMGCKPQFDKDPAKWAAFADKKEAERAAAKTK